MALYNGLKQMRNTLLNHLDLDYAMKMIHWQVVQAVATIIKLEDIAEVEIIGTGEMAIVMHGVKSNIALRLGSNAMMGIKVSQFPVVEVCCKQGVMYLSLRFLSQHMSWYVSDILNLL